MNQSEVARITECIRLEYEASRRVFTDFTATACHAFITRHQENIESCFNQLTGYMKAEEAMALLIQIENRVYCSDKS